MYADQQNYKPRFITWYERDFREDRAVQRMTPHQRALYRNLLMDCYNGDDRPYLTSDDNMLWIIAEADSLEDWLANKALIMSKFKPYNEGLLYNKRVLVEWDILLEKLKHQKNSGLASAVARRTRASLVDKASPVEERKEEEEPKITEQNITPPNPTPPKSVEQRLNSGSTAVEQRLEGEGARACPPVPKEQNQTKAPALLERMAIEYAAVHDGFLNLGGKQKILDLGKKYGEETVEQVWNRWLGDRDLDGLICPLIVFADEFPHVLEDLERIHQPNQETVRESFNLLPMLGDLEPIRQLNRDTEREEQEGYTQIAALNVEAETEAAVINWTEALQAVAEVTIPNIEGCEPGTDKWEHELREWVKRIPPPVLHLNSLDWRADETFEMVIEKGKTRYEHVHDPSRRAAAVAFGVLTQQQADGLAAEAARYSKSLPEPGLAKGKTN